MGEASAKNSIFAAVDIGSYSIKMKIAQVDPNGSVQDLETPKKYINLGKYTFVTGKIGFEQVEEICGILNGFRKLIREYGTDKYEIVATSAIREAKNCDYILDYVYQRTGFRINVINESEERFFTYAAIIDRLKNFPLLRQEGVLIADVSSGGVEITLFDKGELIFTQHIKMGSLRLKEVLSGLERKTLNFPNLIGEFIESELDTLKIVLSRHKIANFLAIGSEINVVHDILGGGKKENTRPLISKESFYSVYHQIVGKSLQQIMEKFGLSSENAETLVPALLMYEKFLSFTEADKIFTPLVSLCDGIIRHMSDIKYNILNKAISERDIVASVKKLGERYSYDEKHARQVEEISMLLFDNTKRLHGYSDRDRLLLQIAAIAHDFGKYINIKSHNELSQDIIKNSEILGMSSKEIEVISYIAKYHSSYAEMADDFNFRLLDYESRVKVSKLAAFLKIADSLDRSHRQKLTGIKVASSDQSLVIKAETSQDSLLEEWEFENKSALFREIYGIEPSLAIKRK